jgi:putative glutamine amidotransferase
MPKIGVIASTERSARRYIESIEKRGGSTLLITPEELQPDSDMIMESIGGLMLTGGEDIDPTEYDELPDSEAGLQLSKERDAIELPLLREGLQRDLPILAICRGMQALNVVMGGKLIQDLPNHRTVPNEDGRMVPSSHRIFVSPGSKLAATTGSAGFVRVNSIHHQGVVESCKATNLLATAYGIDDGIIEGLESPQHSWVVGVQCHPEREEEVPSNWGFLFDALIERSE